MRKHLENVWEQTKVKPKELEDLIELPWDLRQYWEWFLRLHNKRPSGMGVESIPYSEMLSFFQMLGVQPTEEEIELLDLLDATAVKYMNKQQKKESDKAKNKAKKA